MDILGFGRMPPPSARDIARKRRRSAIHEAGHVAVARGLGYPHAEGKIYRTYWPILDPNFITWLGDAYTFAAETDDAFVVSAAGALATLYYEYGEVGALALICDPYSYDPPAECLDFDAFPAPTDTDTLTALSDEFIATGCDRCNLEPCPPLPCEIPTIDICDFISCPPGYECETETKQCCNPVTDDCFDHCLFAPCPEGNLCNPTTGQCEDNPLADHCLLNPCPADQTCNIITGECE